MLGLIRDLHCCLVKDIVGRVRGLGMECMEHVVVEWVNLEWAGGIEADSMATATR
jgi:hypothetical protein